MEAQREAVSVGWSPTHPPFPVTPQSSLYLENVLLFLPASWPALTTLAHYPQALGHVSVPQIPECVLAQSPSSCLDTILAPHLCMAPHLHHSDPSSIPPLGLLSNPRKPQSLSITLLFYFHLIAFHHLTLSSLFIC